LLGLEARVLVMMLAVASAPVICVEKKRAEEGY